MSTNEHPTRALTALIAGFILLALVYNWASPLFENSDEFFHFPFIRYLADNNLSLPVQSKDDLQDWRQEGSQPPLYHIIAAILISPLDTSDYADVRRLNPHAQIGIVGASNINHVLHPLDRRREFEGGTALAVRLVRVLSTLLAAVVVAAAYFLTVYAFPGLPRWVGLLAAGFVAFNPMYLFVASSINNDNLANAMISSVLAILVWLYRRDGLPPVRVLLLIGVLLGISMLSKLSTGPFLLIVGAFWLALMHKLRAYVYMLKWGFAALGIMLLICGWWYVRNYELYGDPTGLNAFLDIVGRRPIDLTAEQLWSEHGGFLKSFWGLFGGLTVEMDDSIYGILSALCGASLLGTGLYFASRRKIDLPQTLLFAWILISFISLIRWTALTWASQGRLWFVAISALATISAVGFYEIGRRLRFVGLAALPVLVTLLIAIAAPFVYIRPAYAAPEFEPISEYGSPLAVLTDPANTNESIALMNADFPDDLRAGESFSVRLTFCAESALSRNWSVYAHLVDEWGLILAQADFTPGYGALPTSEMNAGLCWRDEYAVRIPPGVVSSDTPLEVRVGLYDVRDNTRMVLQDGADYYLVENALLEAGDELQKFAFGDAVRIADYEVSESVVSPGDDITITIRWEVLAPLNADYTVFVQVLDPRTAHKAAASDLMPGTGTWQTGNVYEDARVMTIAEDTPAGVYAIMVGFYQQTPSGEFVRLRLVYDGTDTGFDVMTLAQVRVE